MQRHLPDLGAAGRAEPFEVFQRLQARRQGLLIARELGVLEQHVRGTIADAAGGVLEMAAAQLAAVVEGAVGGLPADDPPDLGLSVRKPLVDPPGDEVDGVVAHVGTAGHESLELRDLAAEAPDGRGHVAERLRRPSRTVPPPPIGS